MLLPEPSFVDGVIRIEGILLHLYPWGYARGRDTRLSGLGSEALVGGSARDWRGSDQGQSDPKDKNSNSDQDAASTTARLGRSPCLRRDSGISLQLRRTVD